MLDTGAARTSVRTDDYTATFAPSGSHESGGAFAQSSDDLIVVPALRVGPITGDTVTVARMATSNPAVRNLLGMDLLKVFQCHFLFDEARVLLGAGEEAPAGVALLPLTLGSRSHPYLDLRWATATASAVWDSGAGITVVATAFIADHPGLFRRGGQTTGTDATGAQQETTMYRMVGPAIGGVRFPALKVAAVDLAAVNARIDIPFDVVLGYNALRYAHWWFDFPRRQWAITKVIGE
jgi:hypothetical protein